MTVQFLTGDCTTHLRSLPDESVDCVVTSPPYWGLRDYGTATWEGGDPVCAHDLPVEGGKNANKGQVQTHAGRFPTCRCGARRVNPGIGLEPTLQEHLDALVAVFREVRRVLKKTGTFWLNYGDAYATGTSAPRGPTTTQGDHVPASWSNRCQKERIGTPDGFKTKDRMLLPARLAVALQADGWWVRDEIIWNKPNPMPSSVRDRTTPAHEMIYLLTKAPKYFFDQEAMREPGACPAGTKGAKGSAERAAMPGVNARPPEYKIYNGYRNKRSVWTVSPKPFKEAHFATFPPALIEPCILAGCPLDVCSACGAPWVRVVEKSGGTIGKGWHNHNADLGRGQRGGDDGHNAAAAAWETYEVKTLGFTPTCKCDALIKPGVVLDPFAGAGTTGFVAQQHGRDAILIELNPAYMTIARNRIYADDLGELA